MTTYNELKAEAARLSARLAFTTDPQNLRILTVALADVLAMLPKYPQGLLWCADQQKPQEG